MIGGPVPGYAGAKARRFAPAGQATKIATPPSLRVATATVAPQPRLAVATATVAPTSSGGDATSGSGSWRSGTSGGDWTSGSGGGDATSPGGFGGDVTSPRLATRGGDFTHGPVDPTGAPVVATQPNNPIPFPVTTAWARSGVQTLHPGSLTGPRPQPPEPIVAAYYGDPTPCGGYVLPAGQAAPSGNATSIALAAAAAAGLVFLWYLSRPEELTPAERASRAREYARQDRQAYERDLARARSRR